MTDQPQEEQARHAAEDKAWRRQIATAVLPTILANPPRSAAGQDAAGHIARIAWGMADTLMRTEETEETSKNQGKA